MPPSAPLLVLAGPDRQHHLARLKELQLEQAIHLFDWHPCRGSTLSAAALSTLIREVPAASPHTVIVIDEAHRLDRACVEVLRTWKRTEGKTARVVLILEEDLPASHPLQALMQGALIERSGARDESASTARPSFALVNALAQRQTASALRAVHEELAAGKDVLELIGLVAWQLQRWVTVRRLVDCGASREQLVSATGAQPWQLDRLQAEVGDRPAAWLAQMLEQCWDVDTKAKSGRVPMPRLALEELVIRLCARPGRGGKPITPTKRNEPAWTGERARLSGSGARPS